MKNIKGEIMKNTIKFLVKRSATGALGMLLALSLTATAVSAQETKSAKEIKEQQKEGRNEAREAAKVFREIMNVPDKAIPRELLEKAEKPAQTTIWNGKELSLAVTREVAPFRKRPG